jgi:hypothetical protein
MGRKKKEVSSEPPAPTYPVYLKVLWRFVRVGLAGGIGAALSIQVALSPDWSNSKAVLLTLSSAFVTGFISAIFMAGRDELSGGNPSSNWQKIPL